MCQVKFIYLSGELISAVHGSLTTDMDTQVEISLLQMNLLHRVGFHKKCLVLDIFIGT